MVDKANIAAVIGDLATAHLGQVLPGNHHLPAAGALDQGDQFQQGGLTCTGVAGEKGHLTRGNVETGVRQRLMAAGVALADIGKTDHSVSLPITQTVLR